MPDPIGVDEAVEYVARAMAPHINALDNERGRERQRVLSLRLAQVVITALTTPRPCPTCEGRRRTPRNPQPPFGGPFYDDCPTCHGTGILDSLAVLRSELERIYNMGDKVLAPDPPVYILRASREVPR